MDGGGIGGIFQTKFYRVNNFGIRGKIYLSRNIGRGIFRVICAGWNFADNLFAYGQRLNDNSGVYNLLRADKISADRKTFKRYG